MLPGGVVIAASGARPPHQESTELIQRDFDGKVIWQFSRNEQITTREGSTIWSARQHHDWQRESFPAGYYSPETTPAVEGGNTLIPTHADRKQPKVADGARRRPPHRGAWKGDIVWGGGERSHRRTGFRRRCAQGHQELRQASTPPEARSTAARQLGDICRRTDGSIKATRDSHPTTSSSAVVKRVSLRLSVAMAQLSGDSVRTSAHRRSSGRFGRSSVSITRTSSRRDCPGRGT